MAIRKSTMQEQVAQAIAEINPSDRPVVTFHTISGPSPWIMNELGLIGQLFVKYYFVTLTEQAVVVHRAGRLANRPKELVHAIPLEQARTLVTQVKRATIWSSLRFQFPGEEKPTRLNIGRYWRAELDQFVPALTGQQIAA
ncbi:hypothetical protein ABT095_14050 [Kitasatospora sp. NPDC002227]|uniref:hypothetical protein n=1 Tax=Kitasatospora sp. NPDC002227 TaxID=3154773 RepID=UPI0033311A6F